MSAPSGEYYTDERWQNWLDRIADADIDTEDEDSARLLLNLQDDAAIAVAKILTDYEEGDIDEEVALGELEDIREVVLAETDLDDEDKRMLVDGVQTSLVAVFYAAEEYVAGGVADEGTVGEYLAAAEEAEQDEDLDAALGYCAQAGTQIADGESLDREVADDLDFGLVVEWANGLDSLETAMADPELVEEDDE
ncbi:DUF2150 family protein [Halococcoides cellulosivorans]|uniref:DUF2150 domain-containing protein n=1 Tax=Halococcoides cellulosivorans TaxID=1679096 RepID=A0A2R4X0V3_9EURY|nr:DUF2150 family protein [Halococcoides cellulosivorans]AWB27429.1 DUF2150 domain-containing protein [Halococcoides cellulosivorans]